MKPLTLQFLRDKLSGEIQDFLSQQNCMGRNLRANIVVMKILSVYAWMVIEVCIFISRALLRHKAKAEDNLKLDWNVLLSKCSKRKRERFSLAWSASQSSLSGFSATRFPQKSKKMWNWRSRHFQMSWKEQ